MHVSPRSRGTVELQAERSEFARRWLLPSQEFLHAEVPGGLILLGSSILALVLANSPLASGVAHFWELDWAISLGSFRIGGDLRELVNDGLMTLFFFVAGLEIKREVAKGQLSSVRRAALPVVAALGGMIAPALIYALLNQSGAGAKGWGVPMATDIAFSIGVLNLLGRRVPTAARAFLLALAIADDIGAIVVIAGFYSSGLRFQPALVAFVLWWATMALDHAGVRTRPIRWVVTIGFWLAVREAGVHPTLAGVILGLSTPSRAWFPLATTASLTHWHAAKIERAVAAERPARAEALLAKVEVLARESEAPLDRRLRTCHTWSSWAVLPLFALANAGVELSGPALAGAARSGVTWGVVLGLVVGKPLGIILLAKLAQVLGWAESPPGLGIRELVGVGLLAGIGFTVSLFVADLAFAHPAQVAEAKVGVLLASLLAGLLGFLFLRLTHSARPKLGPTEASETDQIPEIEGEDDDDRG